jgi:D-beta-D-heptose 7-phosphate kinase/D-beta-D-heptose 1-phosphate adenosyltransferase
MTYPWLDAPPRSPRVWVVGDLMLDRTISGEVHRISPEAPVAVVEAGTSTAVGGGAANLARNLVSLGADVALAGLVGDDAAGKDLVSTLRADGCRAGGVITSADQRTTVRLRVTADGRHLVRVDDDARNHARVEQWEKMVDGLSADLPDPDAVVISDYGQGVVGSGLVGVLVNASPNSITFADPKGSDLTRYRGVSLISPNVAEVRLTTGSQVDEDNMLERAVRHMQAALPGTSVLVTRGPDGMSIFAADGLVHHAPTRPQRTFDVSGAGDTALAAIVVARCLGAPWTAAMDVANIAAGIAVSQIGTSIVHASEVRAALRRRATEAGDHAPVVSCEQLPELGRVWRADGLRVVLTNGCFDLLHPGHIDLLVAAKALGDVLVVALNDDASVRRVKGPDRPVLDLDARAAIVAALRPVDIVTGFSEDTPIGTVLALRPDVLVKGSDYALDDIVGRAEMASWGGRTVVVPLTPGRSSTALRTTIRDGHSPRTTS